MNVKAQGLCFGLNIHVSFYIIYFITHIRVITITLIPK